MTDLEAVIYGALMHHGKPKTVADFERAARTVAEMLERRQAAPSLTVGDAMKVVTDALRADPEYAWSWHCNITMAMVDEGLDHALAEHGAQRFLNLLCPGPALAPAHPLRPKPAAQAEPTAREFTNELGNAIRITIEGPTSTSENILTPREVSELRGALNEHAAQAEPVAWQPIEAAPSDELVVVAWWESDETPHHDFDYIEDGCWSRWHDHAEHVEVIGGHGVSYTPPYTHFMRLAPIPYALEATKETQP